MIKIKEKAKEFNKDYFGGEINISNLTFRVSKKMSRTRGHYTPFKKEITLSYIVMQSEKDWHHTLLHEMIHAWEDTVLKERPGHGFNFKLKAKNIRYLSNGQYKISTATSPLSNVVAEAIQEKRTSRLQNQYMVKRKNIKGYNFLKNLSPGEVEFLIGRGYKVYRVNNPVSNVRHCKNIRYFQRADYYYSERSINRMSVDVTKVD